MDSHRDENPLGCLAEDAGARIVVLVHSVTETHEATLALLGRLDRFVSVVAGSADLLKHFDDCGIGPAMERTPEGADPGGNAGKKIRSAGRDHADGGGAAILFVVGVEQQNEIQRVGHFRLRVVVPVRLGKHHVQEIGRVAQVPARINEGQAPLGAVRHRGERAHFGNKQRRRPIEMFLVELLLVRGHLGVVATE